MTKQIEVAPDDLVDRINTEPEVCGQVNAHRLGARPEGWRVVVGGQGWSGAWPKADRASVKPSRMRERIFVVQPQTKGEDYD